MNLEIGATPEPQEEKNGWIDETEKYGGTINDFIVTHYFRREGDDDVKHYSELTELHLSGGNYDELQKIAKWESAPTTIKVLYRDGQPQKMQATFPGGNDFYISGEALTDLINSMELHEDTQETTN